jgi:pectinesterase
MCCFAMAPFNSNHRAAPAIKTQPCNLLILALTLILSLCPSPTTAASPSASNTPAYSVTAGTQTNIIVAADGSGQFKSVQAGINAAATGSASFPTTLHIKPGTYKELIYIQREKRFLHLIGDDPTNTILTYNLNANLPGPEGKPIGTFRTASMLIDADDLTAENLTFENSAGPVGQALAIRLDGDRLAFRNCRFLGWQDTILANRGRHYYTNCLIAGHVDFIFGAATCWFEKCHVHCLKDGYITAASTPEGTAFGYVFSYCRITGETPEVRTFLGRPWRSHASVAWLNTEMSSVIRPAGWDNWRDPAREKTARFSEFNSTGAGANPSARVPWSRQLSRSEAEAITLKKVLGGPDGWNPAVKN